MHQTSARTDVEICPYVLESEWGMTLSSGRDERKDTPDPTAEKKVRGREKDMGAALRSVYQRAVDEDVPEELLDLLKKLD